ncbi:MAG: TetR/AcrR family transcriptional regulator [Fidelibacterota bacterium]|nr:MAG: TetR/AcrR family transcriptional regulator [Candidatus Neomarinimicrobiota bacterium]
MKLFRRDGIDQTTMEAIAEEADIAKGTLYNYFPIKEAIISEAISQSLNDQYDEWFAKLSEMPDTRSRLFFVFDELIKRVEERRDVFQKYFAYRLQSMTSLPKDWQGTGRNGLYPLGQAIIKLGQGQNEIRDDLPPDTLADLFEFVLMGVIRQYYTNPEKFEPHPAIERSVDLFMHGVIGKTET